MTGLSAGAAMAGAISLYVGLHHMWLHIRRPRRSDLYFAIACAFMTAYDAAGALLYSAANLEDGALYQRLQIVTVTAGTMPLILLVSEQAGMKIRAARWALISLFPLSALVMLVERRGLTLSTVPRIKEVSTPWGLQHIFEVEVGPLEKVMELSAPLLILYFLWVGTGAIRWSHDKGFQKHAQKSSPLIFVAVVLLLTALYDVLVNRGIVEPPYVLEYGWLAVMATMSWSLSNELLEASRTRETLDETERRVASALDAIQDAVVTVDRQGCIIHMNPASQRLLGVQLSQVIDQPLRQFMELTSPETRRVVDDPVHFCLGREPNPYGALPQLVTTDGHERHVDVGGTLLLNHQGVEQGAIVFIRDLTVQHKALQNLEHAKKMESMGQLAGGTAHDLNNLLTPIISYVELLQREVAQQPKQARFLGHIQEAAQRAAKLTRQLLAVSRKQVLDLRVVPISEFVRRTCPIMERLVGEKVSIQWQLSDDAGNVVIDLGQFEQVLLNLTSNARDALDGSGTITIRTRRVSCAETCLEVSDSGSGMSEETAEKIFEPFFTTKPRGKGTGLGLASVRGIIEQHGGSVYVDSEPGIGTSFTIFLPTTERNQPPKASSDIRQDELVRGSESILVVDDDRAVRELMSDVLGQLGYAVHVADNLQQALLTAKDTQLDLLITDVILPDEDGPKIRDEIQKRMDIPCLFMTGHADDRLGDRGFISEGTEVLRKPFSVTELGTRVRAILDGQHRKSEGSA